VEGPMQPQRLGGARLPPPRRLRRRARAGAPEALRRTGSVLRGLDVASGDDAFTFLGEADGGYVCGFACS
jgi:hypothetical protein